MWAHRSRIFLAEHHVVRDICMEEDDTFNVDSGDARYVAIDSSLRFLHVYPQKGFFANPARFFSRFYAIAVIEISAERCKNAQRTREGDKINQFWRIQRREKRVALCLKSY